MFPVNSVIIVVLVTFTKVGFTLPYRNCNSFPNISHMAIPCESVVAVKENCAPILSAKCCAQQLILPPQAVEVPCGLGYSSSAVPVVAEAFSESFFTNGMDEVYVSEAFIPVSPPYACIKLATPLCQEWEPLIKPIIL